MIDKNTLKVLEFRETILETESLEIKYGIKLPPIFKSFYTVFQPYFLMEKYKASKGEEFKQFTKLIYSSLELETYTHEEDEFGLDSFKDLEEMLSFEPSNKDHLKDLLFIGNHGYWGGIMVGIGSNNADKIFSNTGPKPVKYVANNIFELIHKMVIVHDEIDEPWIDKSKLYKNWGEQYWRVNKE